MCTTTGVKTLGLQAVKAVFKGLLSATMILTLTYREIRAHSDIKRQLRSVITILTDNLISITTSVI